MRKEGILTDIDLIVGDEVYKCHRNILAHKSGYFYAMFVNQFSEKSASEVELNCINNGAFSLVLDWIYDEEIGFDQDNVVGILQHASYLQLNDLVKDCFAYLEQNLNVEDVLEIRELAEHYSQ